MNVVALVTDLMDQSRIRAALPDVTFARDPEKVDGADAVIVDLGRFADRVADVRSRTTGRVVAFGSHVDDAALAAARSAGADAVPARSRFFADPAVAVAGR